MKKNPEKAYFKEETDSYESRINRFGQYKNTPSLVWCREVVQNAVDNKATEVALIITESTSGGSVVTFADNGTGMDRKTLQEKFLTMGGTGKGDRNSGDSIGGFGEAKKVILLAWKAWQIVTTKDGITTYAVAENGGREYEIDSFPTPTAKSGTSVSVITWDSNIYTIDVNDYISIVYKSNLNDVVGFYYQKIKSAGDPNLPRKSPLRFLEMRDHPHAERRYLNLYKIYCRLPLPGNAKFTLNDKNGRPAAKVYVERAEGKNASSIYYRGKGLWLWDKYVNVEIEGKISKINLRVIVEFIVKTTTVLSDNRDSISDPVLRKGIDGIIQEIVRDPRIFVRGISKKAEIIYKGDRGSISADEEAMKLGDLIGRSIESGGVIDKTVEHVVKKITDELEKRRNKSPIEMEESVGIKMFEHAIRNIKFEGAPDKTAIQNLIKMAIRSPDIKLLIDDDFQLKGYEIHSKFKPGTMSSDAKKILSLWAEMCRIIFTVRGSRKRFGVGFVFSEETIGLKTSSTLEGCDGFLLVNPYSTDLASQSKMIDIGKIDDVRSMWATCIHECSHMIDDASEHNESYAIALTTSIEKAASCWDLVKRLAVLIGSKNTEIEKSKFSKDIDIDFYFKDDLKRKSNADAKLEKYISIVVEELSSKGGKIPNPEDYGVDVTDQLLDRIKSAASRSSDSLSSANKIVIESLKRRLEEKSKIKNADKLAVIFKNPRGARK